MKTEPQKEHQWLHRLVGEWTYEIDVPGEPGGPPSKMTGTESVRSFGGLWILGEGRGEMPDGSVAASLITLGFSPQTKRFVGTWIGTMMTHLWAYDGELDDAGRVLTLDSEGPAMADDGTMAKYQDIIELMSDDHRVLTARTLGPDGAWLQFMRTDYRRTR
jgi:Protein of unknown function (DUF1579)